MADKLMAMKDWVESFRDDAQALKTVVCAVEASPRARTYAAAALGYLVMRMDLVPDWTETIGVLDDVMVLRICASLASSAGIDGVDTGTLVAVGKMVNQVDEVEAFLGTELYAQLRKYCERLVKTEVRGRTPETVVKDVAARTALFADVDAEILRQPAAAFSDPARLTVELRAYLGHKLKE